MTKVWGGVLWEKGVAQAAGGVGVGLGPEARERLDTDLGRLRIELERLPNTHHIEAINGMRGKLSALGDIISILEDLQTLVATPPGPGQSRSDKELTAIAAAKVDIGDAIEGLVASGSVLNVCDTSTLERLAVLGAEARGLGLG